MLVLVFVQTGCGRKAWPRVEERKIDVIVSDLRVYWSGNTGLMEGRIVRGDGGLIDLSDVQGIRIYHAAFPFSLMPCEGCPIEYRNVSVKKIYPAEDGTMRLELEGLTKGDVHFFQVRVLGEKGSSGPLSARVKLTKPSLNNN